MPVKLLKDTFKAVLNKMPIGKPRLYVTGQVEAPTPGWTVKLVRAQPQGINPLILILELQATQPTGQVNQVVTRMDVRYDEDPAKEDYTNVTIRYEGEEFTIEVEVVQ